MFCLINKTYININKLNIDTTNLILHQLFIYENASISLF
jgi:hypothetical protein